MILNENQDLSEEVDDLYSNIDKIEISIPTCIKIMGFGEYYESILKEVNFQDKEFQKKNFEMKIFVHAFTFKFKDLLRSINYFRNLDE